MAISLNDNVSTEAAKPSDPRQYHSTNRLWTNVTEAHTDITFKYVGLFVLVNDGTGKAVVYWYEEATALETDLVPYQPGGASGGLQVNGNTFTLRKHPSNTNEGVLEVNDMIVSGWWTTTEFWNQAVYLGGTETNENSWNVIDSIEDIPLN